MEGKTARSQEELREEPREARNIREILLTVGLSPETVEGNVLVIGPGERGPEVDLFVVLDEKGRYHLKPGVERIDCIESGSAAYYGSPWRPLEIAALNEIRRSASSFLKDLSPREQYSLVTFLRISEAGKQLSARNCKLLEQIEAHLEEGGSFIVSGGFTEEELNNIKERFENGDNNLTLVKETTGPRGAYDFASPYRILHFKKLRPTPL